MERVVVIGATSGIGRVLAGRLAASGCRVGIVGRRAEPLTERDSDPSENPFFQAAADVTDPAAAVAVLERLVQRMGGMDLCLVAAGAGELNPELDYALELPAIRTNVVGWTAVVDWAYGYFERQGRGHLAVITSVGSLRGSCAAPAYNASKAYQINYTEGLRQRALRSHRPIVVTDLRPGLTDTAMAKGEGLFWVMPVGRVADGMLRAIRRRRAVATVTRRWRLVAWILRLLPGWLYVRF